MATTRPEHGWHDEDAARMIQTSADGTPLDLLVELKARLVSKIADPALAARDLAALATRLLDVEKAIKDAKAQSEDDAEGWLEDILDIEDGPFDPSMI